MVLLQRLPEGSDGNHKKIKKKNSGTIPGLRAEAFYVGNTAIGNQREDLVAWSHGVRERSTVQ